MLLAQAERLNQHAGTFTLGWPPALGIRRELRPSVGRSRPRKSADHPSMTDRHECQRYAPVGRAEGRFADAHQLTVSYREESSQARGARSRMTFSARPASIRSQVTAELASHPCRLSEGHVEGEGCLGRSLNPAPSDEPKRIFPSSRVVHSRGSTTNGLRCLKAREPLSHRKFIAVSVQN